MSSPCSNPHQDSPSGDHQVGLTVFYDGSCPLCQREIALYKALPSSESLGFLDVSHTDALPTGFTREQLLARFHVRDSAGQTHSGARAFLALWAVLPGWRWLARLGALPGMPEILERLYRVFLRVRPMMQRLAQKWERRNRQSDGVY
jgi:predicted DCC family thiol-disulfide oxidoreductase YuxK